MKNKEAPQDIEAPILPFVWQIVRPYKMQMFFGLLALLSVNIVLLGIPQIIARIIDEYGNYTTKGIVDTTKVIWLAVLLTGTSILIFGLRVVWRFLLIVPSYQIKQTTKAKLFRHILSLYPNSKKSFSVGEQIALMSRETDQLAQAISWGTLALADGIISIVGVYIILLVYYRDMAWVSVMIYPLSVGFVYFIWSRIGRTYYRIQARIGEMSELTREMLQNIGTIKAFNAEKYYISRFFFKGNQIIRDKMYISLLFGMLWPILTIVNGSAIIVAVFFGISQIKQGLASIGDLSAVMNYLMQVEGPFMGLSFALDIQQKGFSNAKRIRKMFAVESSIKSPPNPLELSQDDIDLRVENLEFQYSAHEISDQGQGEGSSENPSQFSNDATNDTGVDIGVDVGLDTNSNGSDKDENPFKLGPLSISLEHGQWLGITGSIGSGKSTLAKLLARLYDATDGAILYNNNNIKDYELEKLHDKVLLQSQQFQLFSWPLSKNILFSEDDISEDNMQKMTYYGLQAGLEHDIKLFEYSWHTQIGEAGILLSGGQKQRVVLARSIIQETPLLILDDIFSGLDYKTANIIVGHLKKLRKNRTTILISHNLPIISAVDKIIIMDKGLIVEEGTHHSLLKNPHSMYTESWREYLISQGQMIES